MRSFTKSIFLVFFFVMSVSIIKQKKTKIIFFGDSIMQAGINAGGYITQMQETLQKKGSAANIIFTIKNRAFLQQTEFISVIREIFLLHRK